MTKNMYNQISKQSTTTQNSLRSNMIRDLQQQLQQLLSQNSLNPKVVEKIENVRADLYFWTHEEMQR
ncbi:MAG: hypothetical protein JSS79_05185 [Bacteroidetes bacterium]|nr:hypothetical protein [Bacteroidota bacterium]